MGFDVTCPSDGVCSAWVFHFFHDCVCSTRDKVSFGLGLASIFSWGVAEIPQIIANWKAGTSEHVSFAFILTWTIGDLFNLTGCYLSPATLPTQFYTALLYTLTTLVLVFQHIWFTWLKPKSSQEAALKAPLVENEENSRSQDSLEGLFPSDPSLADGTTIPGDGKTRLARTQTAPIPSSNTTRQRSPQPSGNSYSYGSYRRMTMSPSLHSIGTVMMITTGVQLVASPLLGGSSGGYDGMLGGAGLSGRKLLHAGYGSFAGQSSILEPEVSSTVGLLMGWAMTAIYLMGRLPQILLNIRRGSVEGLSMSMFVFAITGNATYLGSILVRSTNWSELGPNLPWLVDAACCLAMDLIILGQFVWFKSIGKRSSAASEGSQERGS